MTGAFIGWLKHIFCSKIKCEYKDFLVVVYRFEKKLIHLQRIIMLPAFMQTRVGCQNEPINETRYL